jgi:hypothetical protein
MDLPSHILVVPLKTSSEVYEVYDLRKHTLLFATSYSVPYFSSSNTPHSQQQQNSNNENNNMAAVLCSTLADVINSTCRAVGHVICLPCRALNLGCEKLGDILCSPMMPFVFFTFGLMTPALVYGVRSLDNSECSDLFRWLIVNAVFAIFHMVGCLYIVQKLKEPGPDSHYRTSRTSTANPGANAATVLTGSSKTDATKMEEGAYVQISNNFTVPKDHERGGPNSISRAKHVLCFDKGMAVYILVILIWVVWICIGINRRFSVDEGNPDCNELTSSMNVTIMCGYVWMSMVSLAFCCSFLCLR